MKKAVLRKFSVKMTKKQAEIVNREYSPVIGGMLLVQPQSRHGWPKNTLECFVIDSDLGHQINAWLKRKLKGFEK